jgi:hypothetical protein
MTFIHRTGVWPEGCLITLFYGHAKPILNLDSHITSRSLSPVVTSSLATPTSGLVPLIEEADGGRRYTTYLKVNCCDANMCDFSMSNTRTETTSEIFYQNIRGLRTKQTELLDNVYSMDYQTICLNEKCLNDMYFDHQLFPDSFTIFHSDRVTSTKPRVGAVLINISFRVYLLVINICPPVTNWT